MPKDVILTPEGLQKLKDELEDLSINRRRAVADRIKEAREFGDISENSEYDDAKDVTTDAVGVGSVVNIKDEKGGSLKFTIVGSAEANPAENKLSNESPVGKALMGRKRGEEVSVALPNGKKRKFKITKIDVGL
jgi:transcription elongation factor GreA